MFHHIDNFIVVRDPETTECEEYTVLMDSVCEKAGLPIEPDKDEVDCDYNYLFGLELDSLVLEIHYLSQEKLSQLRALLAWWRGRKICWKRDLLSLIGLLSHACKAVYTWRSFLRRLGYKVIQIKIG